MKILIICSILLFSFSSFAKKKDFHFCKKRITPTNYPILYKKIKKLIKKSESYQAKSPFAQSLKELTKDDTLESKELCQWNKFIFIDFLLYFSQLKDFNQQENKLELLELRDNLYSNWLSSLEKGSNTQFSEWESEDLTALSLEEFLEKGSKKFKFYEVLGKIVSGSPKKSDLLNEKRRAKYVIGQLLRPRTPFSSIYPKLALSLAADQNVNNAVNCIQEKMSALNCEETLWEQAQSCTDNDTEMSLQILGVLGSQRMYLLRDFKSYLDQTADKRDYSLIMDTLKQSSHLYFLSETMATKCGAEKVYFEDIESEHELGRKSYHFWSVAYLSYYLTNLGFNNDIVLNVATKPAKKYKNFIRIPALLYNVMLNVPLGTNLSEYKNVLVEQEMGAVFGNRLANQEE